MIYDIGSRELRKNNGKVIKKLDCPLHKAWHQLSVIEESTQKRHCASCRKNVLDLTGFDENDVERMCRESPDMCVYVAPNAANITVQGIAYYKFEPVPCPFRRIQTARGEAAINQGVKDGFWPLVKTVEPSPKFRTWMDVYQNQDTGQIRLAGDCRYRPDHPWKRIFKGFKYYPYPETSPIAAYLLPADLKVGERVFLTDLIEHYVGVFGNQGHTHRLPYAYAVWNGTKFIVEWNELRDADHLIG